MTQIDKAGAEYWRTLWANSQPPAPLDVAQGGLDNFVNQAFHAYIVSVLGERGGSDAKLLELGCAQSVWLPYFAHHHGFDVTGLDYDEGGCARAEALLARANVNGRIVTADVMQPPKDMLGAYDVVTSFGLVEHFSDTAGFVDHCARFLAPGGLMLTEVPNMHGVNGWLCKQLNRPVYDIHVPLDVEALVEAHRRAGLEVLDARYLISLNLCVPHFEPFRFWPVQFLARAMPVVLSKLAWAMERAGLGIPVNRWTSPYVFCVATKPA
jgi:2-polyprenyl-3-methyl-5-hydroxy-6-metoxy-1,4-benzoquinol methylase